MSRRWTLGLALSVCVHALAVGALVGWSWLFGDHVFVSVQAGVSSGYETGRETTAPRAYMPMEMRTTTDVGRMTWAGEGFIRIGGAFSM